MPVSKSRGGEPRWSTLSDSADAQGGYKARRYRLGAAEAGIRLQISPCGRFSASLMKAESQTEMRPPEEGGIAPECRGFDPASQTEAPSGGPPP